MIETTVATMKRADAVPATLVFYGVTQLALGLWMLFAPGSFFDALGPFGAQNDHYIRDVSTWNLALGVVCLLVARGGPVWHRGRAAVLLFAGLQALAHTVNHVADAGSADPGWVGVFDAISLGAVAAALLVVWRIAQTAEARA